MDYGGIVLFSGGLILFLLGLSWGGGLYAWGSSHVIATLVVGIVTLIAFVLYGKDPPDHLNNQMLIYMKKFLCPCAGL